MTKTTEELKREMYGKLAAFRIHAVMLDDLEQSLETYLEALRQDLKMSHVATGDVAILLHEMKSERDELRNKLQAFEFANKSAGEMLQAANEKVKRQRQSIGQLKNERDNAIHLAKVRTTQRDKLAQQLQEARKDQGAASVSDSAENDPESILRSVQRNCQHSFRQQHEFPSGKLQSECIFCLKVEG